MRDADQRFFIGELRAGKILGKPFIEPRLGSRIIRVQQHVRVIVQHGRVRIRRGSIYDDEVLVFSGFAEPGSRSRFASREWRVFLELSMAAESNDLRRNRKVDLIPLQQSSECGAHLLHPKPCFLPLFLARVSDQEKMWSADLHPATIGCAQSAGKKKQE